MSKASDTPMQVQPEQAGIEPEADDGRQGSHSTHSMPAATPPQNTSGNAELPLADRTQPTAVTAIREYAKGQIRIALRSIKQIFAGRSNHSEQGNQEQQLKTDKS